MIVLAVTWRAKTADDPRVQEIFSALSQESRQEPGCLMFQVHRHKTDRRRFFIYEQYKDEAALESHRKTAHFLKYARTELPLVADRVEGELFDPI